MSLISAIVPTFNRAGFLGECLDSLFGQTRPLAEIIVVDDGCTDDTAAVLGRYGTRLRVLRQDNAGKAAALNNALGQVRGDLVWICDDDDIALPQAAERLAAPLDAGIADVAYGRYLVFHDDRGQRSDPRPPGYWPSHHQTDTLCALLEDCFIFQFATLVRRRCYDAVGPFRQDLVRSQDYDMTLRLARRYPPVFVDAPLFLQRDHAGMRGTAQTQFNAEANLSRWVHYDRMIFTRLRSELALMDYLPNSLVGLDPDHRRRAALLQRGCVFARHQMWDEALEDLAAAAALDAVAPLHLGEQAIAGRFLTGKAGCLSLAREAGLAGRIAQACEGTAFGQTLLRALAQPLVWRSREAMARGRARDSLGYVAALGRMCGVGGLAGALGQSALRRLQMDPSKRLSPTG